MSKNATVTEPRRKRVPKRKHTASKAVGKSILYICERADSEFDLVTSFVEELFSRSVRSYPWEKPEVDDEEFRKEDPCCIIMSVPMESEAEAREDFYGLVRKAFPEVPILWLAPSNGYEPKLSASDKGVTVLDTEHTPRPMYPFLRTIADLTGIEPKVALDKAKE